ncbi:uncharacterized protein Hap1MRO34_017081 isoform 2-T2 [Clarias gariepinus]
MIAHLIQRYSSAGVAPPRLLYVDTDCCKEDGETRLKKRFSGWPDLIVKLDIYHFMRRLASGCTNEAHPLYKTFMAKLSCCIFEWDSSDVALLRKAKREQLKKEGVPGITQKLVDEHITKDELSLHCRRRTRGEQQTFMLIEQLLNELKGVKGSDLLGVPLFDWERMEHIWRVQKRHVKCIQDEPGVLLYTETGCTNKGGIILPNYRCARGSTSLESFHCHVNRFIPGTSANSLNFQLYLLEGIHRWNQDREAASLAVKPPSLLSYSGDLVHCANTHSVKVLGKKLVPSFQPPGVYTGELIGIEYLNWQTGQAMQDQDPDAEQTNEMLEDVGSEEELQDEGFEDGGVDPTIELMEFTASSSVSSAATTTSTCINETPTSPQAAVSTVAATSPRLPATDASLATPGKQLTNTESAGPSAPSALPSSSAPMLHIPVSHTATLPSTPTVAVLARSPSVPQQQLAVDEHCVPGMDLVDSLAEYLVGLRTESGLTLNNQQASTIIELWQDLLPYDKQRVAYAARHQVRLTTGRFRRPKAKGEFTPGVESMTRCVLGSTGSPAQWPDCCRLVEAIFVRLCGVHKSPKKQKNTCSLTRWTLILRDYKNIRQLVLGNGLIMQSTTLQLPDVNQTTLIQWHNKRLKRQDFGILLQGVNLPPSIPVAPVPLPPVRTRPTAATPQPGPQHQYHLPVSTVGQAVVKRKSAAGPHPCAPQSVRPRLQAQRQLFPQPPPPPSCVPITIALNPTPANNPFVFLTPQIPALRSIAPAGPLPAPTPVPRAYNRTVKKNKCSQCGQLRNKETGHTQYYGCIYCPQTANMPVEQWMEDMRRKRADKK